MVKTDSEVILLKQYSLKNHFFASIHMNFENDNLSTLSPPVFQRYFLNQVFKFPGLSSWNMAHL